MNMHAALSWLERRNLFRATAAAAVLGLVLVAVGFPRTRGAEDAKPSKNAETRPGVERTEEAVSPIFGVKIPDGYRQWELISVSQGKDELKGIVGNVVALKAYRENNIPFPDGSVLVKISWRREPLPGFDDDFVPGAATMVQIMVKDSKKYAATVSGDSVDSSTAGPWTPRSTTLASFATRRTRE
jgi:hypothetical protein